MEKKQIRKYVLDKLQVMEDSNQECLQQIHQNLYQNNIWQKAKVIGITISKTPEVSTREIILKAWELGKKVVVPKCDPIDRSMIFYAITSFEQTEQSFYGVLEPIPELCVKVELDEIELLIIPGLGFNPEGFRVGFGGGYYDRLLVHYNGQTVAIAFEWQTKFDFANEIHDKKVDRIITERKHIVLDK